MPPASPRFDQRSEQDFDLRVLRSDDLELAVAPQLGAKVVSLKNLRSAREWLWSPTRPARFFSNQPGDDFSTSTLIGWDECLPTISPCAFAGRELPDHGEAWSAEWRVEASDASSLRTVLELPVSPLRFARSLCVKNSAVLIDYELTNHSKQPEHFIWAMHPLVAIAPGDRLELPDPARASLASEPWFPSLKFGSASPACAKRFIPAELCLNGAVSLASVVNDITGDRLEFEWNPAENDTLGIWLTRGGWHGHHHLALEPTNAPDDSLSRAAESGHCGIIAPGAVKRWRVTLRLGVQE